MFTTCPHCTLLMAVMVGDLRQGQGYVRCCRCYSIFNALATLTVDGPASARAVERLDAALPAGPPVIVDSDEVIDGNATTGEYPVLPPELLQTLEPVIVEPPVVQAVPAVQLEPLATQPLRDTATTDIVADPADRYESPEALPVQRWRSLAVVMAVVLAVLLVHRFRQVLVEQPLLTRPLGQLYSWMGQTLEPHWDLTALDVRVLQAVSANNEPPRLEMRFSVANQGKQTLPLPVLRLRLTDRFGVRVGQRTISALEYLRGRSLQHLKPGQRLDSQIVVPDPGRNAEGYEIDACLTTTSGALQCPPEPATR
jgi:hypothetical protein